MVRFIYVPRLINNYTYDVQDLVFPHQQKFVMKDIITDRQIFKPKLYAGIEHDIKNKVLLNW